MDLGRANLVGRELLLQSKVEMEIDAREMRQNDFPKVESSWSFHISVGVVSCLPSTDVVRFVDQYPSIRAEDFHRFTASWRARSSSPP